MRWDIFCKVIDNHGDLGVCWRLSRDLAGRGHAVRLWVDDAAALQWMAPEASTDGLGHPGVTVLNWPAADAPPPSGWPVPGDVVVEAFGCELPAGFVARMQRPAPPRWINLEYLSAEEYVERSHGLRSPVFSGPGAGLLKHFFYPGFTERTGGLLREADLFALRDAVQGSDIARARTLKALGVPWQPGERVVSVFCYPGAPVQALLHKLGRWPAASGSPVTHVLLTPGAATRGAQDLPTPPGGLRLHALPYLPQPAYDSLLWACDLNMVRGEDSAVRALWAGRPHVWHIYPQDDGVHEGKLQAFMNRWMAPWPPALAADVQSLWRAWNDLPTQGPGLDALDTLWQPSAWPQWQAQSRRSSDELSRQPDLVTQLLQFVTAPG